MSEMVEKVARAVFEEDQLDDETKLSKWDSEWNSARKIYLEVARTAIRAMREPTSGMKVVTGQMPEEYRAQVLLIWQMMIDAALSEGLPTVAPDADISRPELERVNKE